MGGPVSAPFSLWILVVVLDVACVRESTSMLSIIDLFRVTPRFFDLPTWFYRKTDYIEVFSHRKHAEQVVPVPRVSCSTVIDLHRTWGDGVLTDKRRES